MKREYALEFSKVTEAAALASFKWIGTGDKISADDDAVSAMRYALNLVGFSGEIVIGEGEIDEAPMLYIGEKVGSGGEKLDIAVDPIDGTRMVALGQENAVAVMVLADQGKLLKAPDMYMEKIMVNYLGKGVIDLDNSIEENIKALAKKLNKKVKDIKVMTLAKPRHEETIKRIQSIGAKVVAIPDGDVAGSIQVAMPETGIDMFYGIGGAPEGVISGAIMRAMDGDIQARLITRSDAKGACCENDKWTKIELDKCQKLNIDVNKKLMLDDLISTDNLIVTITGITDGSLLKGVTINGTIGTTETLLIRGKTRTVRRIQSTHYLDLKDDAIKDLILN
ncbi:MAG: class II fructose-bisphosphatase [Mycoplasmatales bacterium]